MHGPLKCRCVRCGTNAFRLLSLRCAVLHLQPTRTLLPRIDPFSNARTGSSASSRLDDCRRHSCQRPRQQRPSFVRRCWRCGRCIVCLRWVCRSGRVTSGAFLARASVRPMVQLFVAQAIILRVHGVRVFGPGTTARPAACPVVVGVVCRGGAEEDDDGQGALGVRRSGGQDIGDGGSGGPVGVRLGERVGGGVRGVYPDERREAPGADRHAAFLEGRLHDDAVGDVRGVRGAHGVRGGLQGLPEEVLPSRGEARAHPRRGRRRRRRSAAGGAPQDPAGRALQHGPLPRHQEEEDGELGAHDGSSVPRAAGQAAPVPVEVHRGRGRGDGALVRHAVHLRDLGEGADGPRAVDRPGVARAEEVKLSRQQQQQQQQRMRVGWDLGWAAVSLCSCFAFYALHEDMEHDLFFNSGQGVEF